MGGIRRDGQPTEARPQAAARDVRAFEQGSRQEGRCRADARADADARVPHLRLIPEGDGRLLASSAVLARERARPEELTWPDPGRLFGEAA
jgi:hypothetical protein